MVKLKSKTYTTTRKTLKFCLNQTYLNWWNL